MTFVMGWEVYSVMPRQSTSKVKSLESTLEGLSMGMLKSPIKTTMRVIAKTDVNSDESSVRKTSKGFGGL